MTKNKIGRPTLLTEEVKLKLITAIQWGASYDDACSFAGISYRDFHNWMKRGEKEAKGEWRDFFQRIKKAETDCKVKVLSGILKAGEKNWTAYGWYLERKYPNEFGRRDRQDVNMQHSGDVKIVFEDVWPEGKGPKKKSKPEPADKK